jgi:Aldehyde:ferredoxin oxidoreductase
MGAVMGSKNLKAIAVKGSGQIKVKEPERLRSNINRLLPYILSYPTTQIYSIYGTAGEVEEFYEYGDMPIKNFTVGKWDNVYNISGRAFREKGLVKAHRPVGHAQYTAGSTSRSIMLRVGGLSTRP